MNRLPFALMIAFSSAAALAQNSSVPGTAVASPGVSPTTAPASAPAKPKEKLICEEEETLGTRLGGHRVCRTRAQIAEQRLIDRDTIDRTQTQRSCSQTGC